MIPDAAKMAIEIAIETSPVSAICTPVDSNLPMIPIDCCGFGGMTTETQGANGQMVVVQQHDARSLIVWPDDLKANGEYYEPQPGDAWQITLPSGEVVRAECAPFPPESHWRWTDRFQTAKRIHLKIQDS